MSIRISPLRFCEVGRRAVGAASIMAALALAACASGSAPAASRPQAAAAAAGGDGAEIQLGALSARELASGECGLFLWTRTPSPALVFFANPTTGAAAIALDGRELALRRVAAEGATAAGRPGAQTFATPSGDVSLRLTVQDTEPVENGYRVTSATLRVTNVAGWSSVAGAAGLAACQP